MAERLRCLTAQQSPIGQVRCAFTVSIGVVVLTEAKESLRQLLQKADEALYRAKEQGRNRVDVWGNPL